MEWLPTPVFLRGESHGERSLVGYSSWGRKDLDMTGQPTLTYFTIASHRIFLIHMLMTMLQWGRGVIISSLQMRLKKIIN